MSPVSRPRGPFHTVNDVIEAAEPLRAALAAARASDQAADRMRKRRTTVRTRHITGALTACGVELGELDRRVVRWLASVGDAEESVVVSDWILRARQAAEPSTGEAEQPVISWVLYKPQGGSDVLEPAGVDGDVSFTLDVAELAVDKLVEYATGAWDRVVKVYGTRGQLAAWAQWEDGEAVAYRNGGTR